MGKRPVGVHFDGLQALGAKFQQDEVRYYGKAAQLIGSRMFLGEASVTATENVMMAAALAHGTTVIEPAACEPHIVSLGNMLIAMGAKIEGLGTHSITIQGVGELKGTSATINADEIETGTLAVAIGLTHGNATLHEVEAQNLASICHKLNQFGIITEFEGTKIKIGAVLPLDKDLTMEISGSNAISGLPESILVTSSDVVNGVREAINEIIGAVKVVLQKTPPELAADIMDKGIVMTGGSSKFRKIDELFTKITGVPCQVADEPELCVVRGTGIAVEHLDEYKRSMLWSK